MNREILEKRFAQSLIKSRKGRGNKTLAYLETCAVIKRLNDAFDGEWSFRVLDHKLNDKEVYVLGELTADGVSKQQFGGVDIKFYKDDRGPISIGDDLKSATSDCIKKCATLFGVGLHLYGDYETDNQQADTKTSPADKQKNQDREFDSPDPPNTKSLSEMSLGELKTCIMDLEKLKGVTGEKRVGLRKKHLDTQVMSDDTAKLIAYHTALVNLEA